jgi:hypothetical protein
VVTISENNCINFGFSCQKMGGLGQARAHAGEILGGARARWANTSLRLWLSEYPVVKSVKQDDRCLSQGTSSFNPCIVSVSGSAQIEVASPNVSRISFRPSAEGICTIPPLASVTLQGQRNRLTGDENRRGGRPDDLNSVYNTPRQRQYLD